MVQIILFSKQKQRNRQRINLGTPREDILVGWMNWEAGTDIYTVCIKQITNRSYRIVQGSLGGAHTGAPQVWPLVGKESSCRCRRCKTHSFEPWVGKGLWSRKWQLTSLFWPGKSQGQRSLAGYSPWGSKQQAMTEHSRAYTHTAGSLCRTEKEAQHCTVTILQQKSMPHTHTPLRLTQL